MAKHYDETVEMDSHWNKAVFSGSRVFAGGFMGSGFGTGRGYIDGRGDLFNHDNDGIASFGDGCPDGKGDADGTGYGTAVDFWMERLG